MNERRKIEDRVAQKEKEIQELDARIRDARVYVQALQDVLKLLPRAAPGRTPVGGRGIKAMRAGSAAAQARESILKAGRPLHIGEILAALGREQTRATSAALAGSLSWYVRKGEIFTRPAPNTFGLVEMGHANELRSEEDHPPPDFGEDQEPADTEAAASF